ncbi:muconolactone Delta-isomerase family protein [Humibacillus xanthopallidus]|uniref:Muconolactone delta-isomerase n=1 Tax=Humibacillus xanthopallidus TaxID=412689 RepID=A0A543I2B3_9MICO|nr:muconolactone Delta-isomerase family protein [Humibacillus xanthopallidus]TQM64712.1 muconolactone delta-isomerase [Humibacillus xanthopallidus]
MGQTEYLVTMTTHVPDGVDDAEVAEVRSREAANTARLAERGSVLRLWRPPLSPGQWRSIGLFAATDETELERILSAMPLRKWRTDEVTPLDLHPNDPAAGVVPRDPDASEFLTTFTVRVPANARDIDAVMAGEARRAGQLADQNKLRRLWRLPEQGRALGLWQVHDTEELTTLLGSLPMTAAGWLSIDTVALTPHPSDPALARTAAR